MTVHPSPQVVPALKQWIGSDRVFILSPTSRLILDTSVGSDFLPNAKNFSAGIYIINQIQLPVVQTRDSTRGDIVLSIKSNNSDESDSDAETYELDIQDVLTIQSATQTGLVRGITTVLQMFKLSLNPVSLPGGKGKDWPVCRERGLLLDVGRYYFSLSFIKNLIQLLAWQKCNILHLHFSDDLGFRLKSDLYPELSSPESYSKADIRDIQDFAALYKIMIIPEIDLPAHAGRIREVYPEFKNDDPSLEKTTNTETLCLVKPASRQFIWQLLDEFIPLFDAPYFHLGADEWPDWSEKPERLNQMINQAQILKDHARNLGFEKPADVFIKFINDANSLVKRHGKQLRIWEGYNRLDRSLEPDRDIIIEPWTPDQAQVYLDQGYSIINPTEEYLYMVPGLYYPWPPFPGYDKMYTQWHPGRFKQDGSLNVSVEAKGFLGAKLSVWTDVSKKAGVSETMVFGHLYPHLQIFASKTWGSQLEPDYTAFRQRAEPLGLMPGSSSCLVINDHARGQQLNQFSFSDGWLQVEKQDTPMCNDYHVSDKAGSFYQVKFNGCRVLIAARKDNSCGKMAVSIDNNPEKVVDLYASELNEGCLVYDSGQIARSEHVLTVRVTGEKKPLSTGVSVMADAVMIYEY